MPVVSIFGRSDCGPGSFEYDEAQLLGSLLSAAGLDVATGAYSGVMESALKGAAENPGRRIGVTTEFYLDREKNIYVNQEISTHTYIERLEELLSVGDAYVIFPGGTGTLLELAAILALKDRGQHLNKLCICIGRQWRDVLNAANIYPADILENFFLLKFADTASEAFEIIAREMIQGYNSELKIKD